jgi:uncharacterized C2H2 Zn-finger protein
MVVQCKLCGTIIKDEADMSEHRKNHHSWYDGTSIIKGDKDDNPNW